MFPRRQSIFHLGEEGGAAAMSSARSGVRRAREREPLLVGLQILVYHHHGRHDHQANVVLKPMVRPRAAATVSCSFLKACSLCRLELSPNKDVYMYR
jgi:predicted naringenin-chalcone synthase